MSVLLFGGAFNPPHVEHQHILRAAVESLKPEKVIVLPGAISPHKQGKRMASPQERLQMCRLAFGDIPAVEVSDYEIAKGGVSYSYLTCEHFASLYPDKQLVFLMGADMLQSFSGWKFPERILKVCDIAACAREDDEAFGRYRKNFNLKFQRDVIPVPYVGEAVSSTKVRVLAALGEDITPFVGAKVAEYVATNDVYLHPLSQKVKGLLTASRWQHTVGVCLAAVKNCGQAKATEDSAFTAALLHDVAKYIPADSELLQGFVLPEGVPSPVVHQFAGAYVAEHAFGITDDDILNAIRYHTSGRAGMSALEKLIYLADMVEDGRNFPGVGEMRTLFYSDLDKCLQTVLCHQMDYLSNSGAIVYGLTRQAYDFYK